MTRPLTAVIFLLLSSLPSWSQCSRQAGTPIDMQVHLSFEDEAPNTSTKVSGLPDSTPKSDAGASGSQRGQFDARMQIRVQLQDQYGSGISDTSPNSEGKIVFRVCSKPTYRMRVTGPDIEEVQLDNLVPGQGDKIMSVVLRHKGSASARRGADGLVSASRLNIPRKARKELEKGNKDLADGKLPQAQKHFENAVAVYPQFDQAYNNLGVVLMQTGHFAEGKAAFQKAVASNDHFARALVNLAKIAVDEKDFNKAYQLSQTALTSEPLNPMALFVAAEASYFAGNAEESVTLTHRLHTLPHQALGLAHFLSGKALQLQGRTSQAMSEYQFFLLEEPKDPNVPVARQMLQELQARSTSVGP
jgi:tetratricopeptide (TPR) repeat protein